MQVANENTNIGKINIIKEEYFTFNGMQEFFDHDGFPITSIYENMACKSTIDDKDQHKYFIKLNAAGDPFNFENQSSYKNKTDRVLSQDIRFKKVDEDTFKMYKMYLKTSNKIFLKEVERRML